MQRAKMKCNVTFPRSVAGEDCHVNVIPNVRFVFSFYTLYLTSYFDRNPGLVSQYRLHIPYVVSLFIQVSSRNPFCIRNRSQQVILR